MTKIRRALISVHDKTDLIKLGEKLAQLDIEIISTGGTAKTLRSASIAITDVSDHTQFPEMLDGRVKTLHPKIHGGLLAVRDNPKHLDQTEKHGIEMIDLVVCNLYPFEATIAQPNVTLDQAIENIDIGGPTMIRSAAKNYRDVAVVTSPDQYETIIDELEKNDGVISAEMRFDLAKSAFSHTADYDREISNYLSNLSTIDPDQSEILDLRFTKVQSLRYGENPHQSASFYRSAKKPAESCVSWADQLNGQPLSYNNLLDLEAALEIAKDFEDPACAIVKHNNPCGLATHDDPKQAFLDALDCDRVSAFGSIIGFNRKVELKTANAIRSATKSGIKIEAIIAPSFNSQALKLLSRVRSRRILATGEISINTSEKDRRHIVGGLLIQDRDLLKLDDKNLTIVTDRKPTNQELRSLKFAWKACKQIKSNAIVLAKGTQTIGLGAGQMSRVDSCIIAVRKAGDLAKNSVLASDAFFPFPDGIEIAGEAGVSAIIQPGGSVNDEIVIETADRYKMAMIFTGVRHFKH